MKKIKKGFTIVELVIVIAVIGVLAAVLMPTFSNIIAKANLSADKQAVREMNMALATWEASESYAKPENVDTVLQVLANAGYNTDNWTCLTSGYQVYWYKNDNRMILYNSSLAAIEYPDEYVGTKTMVSAENNFFVYNYNHVKAQQFDMSLGSHITSGTDVSGKSSLSSAYSATTVIDGVNSNQTANINSISSAVSSNANIANALKSSANSAYGSSTSGDLVYYATREVVSAQTANAYASLQVSAVGTEENPVKLQSNGKLVENLYYISVVAGEGASQDQIKQAQKAAGEYVYNIFDQMTTGKVTDKATIILEAGTTIDCSTCEWSPCKTFSGYFGTTDAAHPIIINGATLTSLTGHAQTVAFNGSSSKYFVTGFFGTVYGNTTIENVKFTNVSITTPAIDYELTTSDRNNNKINTRNTVGIIGGITDNYSESNTDGTDANVVIRNVVVEDSVSITGAGCVGGLVGYIGSQKETGKCLHGNILIENCTVSADIESIDKNSSAGYKAVGGIIGFTCRVDEQLNIAIKDCTFDGKADGYGCVGALVGALQNKRNVSLEGTLNLNACTLNANGTASAARSLVGYTENYALTTSTATLNLLSGLDMTGNSTAKEAWNLIGSTWTKK